MLSGISTGCRGNAESTTAADRENECNCEYGGVYVCAESVNNADVSTSCVGTAGRRDSAVDVITSVESGGNREKVCSGICAWYGGNTGSDTAAAGWRGNAVDVIVWSTGTASGRGSAADVITSPTGTDGANGRIGIDVISSSTGGGRGGIIDVITSCTGAAGGRDAALADREKVCGSRRDGVSERCADPRWDICGSVYCAPTGAGRDRVRGKAGIGMCVCTRSVTADDRGGMYCAVNSLASKDKDGRCMFCAVNASVSQNKDGRDNDGRSSRRTKRRQPLTSAAKL